LCKKQCKLIEIDKQMPSEVRVLFESDSTDKMVRNIKKIHRFQENQIKLFVEKNRPELDIYKGLKADIQKLQREKDALLAGIRAENDLIKRLQVAYK
jgi:hypothetical protein